MLPYSSGLWLRVLNLASLARFRLSSRYLFDSILFCVFGVDRVDLVEVLFCPSFIHGAWIPWSGSNPG
jgi:hypothetical protein